MKPPSGPRDRLSADFHTPVASPERIPPPRRCWTDAEWERIRQGHIAPGMDEKWDFIVEGERLFLHRSWTGFGMYEARFKRDEEGWKITDLYVCGDRDRYRRGLDDYETTFFELLVNTHLLDEDDPELLSRWRALYMRSYSTKRTDVGASADAEATAAPADPDADPTRPPT